MRDYTFNPANFPGCYRNAQERQHNLNRSEWQMLMLWWQAAGQYGACQLSNGTIARACGLRERQVRNIIALLETRGYGFRDNTHCNDATGQCAIWRFYGSDAYHDYVIQCHREDEMTRAQQYTLHYDESHNNRFTHGMTQAQWNALKADVDGMDYTGFEECEDW